MLKRIWFRGIVLTLIITLWIPGTIIQADPLQEGKTGITVDNLQKQPLSWDQPGYVSPVLRPGPPSAVGMSDKPLGRIVPEIKKEIRKGMMPGAVVWIARRGTVVKHEGIGDAVKVDQDGQTPLDQPISMDKDTIFDVASISKIFTTVAAMKLYEEGKFQLDDPVTKHLPEFSQSGKEKVTIRQLMTHTSGFEASIPLYKMGNNREERLEALWKHPLKNEPGTVYTYSDLNMITLGVLVESWSGQSLDSYIKEKITDPLGMKDTMFNPPASLYHRIAATEYQKDRGMVRGEVHDEKAWSLDGVAGHAGLFSTATDLGVFSHMLLRKGKYGDVRILQPKTVDLMEENQNGAFPDDDHGLGWELNQPWYMDALADPHSMGHTGFTGTSFVVNRDNDTIAILLTNRVHPTRQTPSINPVRRQVARLTADAIPVQIPKGKSVWFSGYGDDLNRSLLTELPQEESEKRVLMFKTWYRTEELKDYGRLEGSADGKSWTALSPEYTGSSEGWLQQKIHVPRKTRYLRFRYHTDSYANGRGWYVGEPVLTGGGGKQSLKWTGEGWKKRKW
ncbi:serine hydrolase [Kroppenstedtia pulmonis]|uniref:Serine hydrolase n=1 Tax=Kroppenstedtia pulmonis TaxID=1380685 RepID=A0A7D3YAP8_9BACL|nr:serine hydrolase domain-containing protein [Kroppenstedtia pulmonis]QKG85001.1 serine hydrolase [Kroppenstedtia pulmonis]